MSTDDPVAVPYIIHTNRELELMLERGKPLAHFSDWYPPEPDEEVIPRSAFAPHVATGFVEMRSFVQLDQGPPPPEAPKLRGSLHVLYARPAEAWRIDAYIAMLNVASKTGWSEGFERLEGTLLGYTEQQNDIHIEAMIRSPHADHFPWLMQVLQSAREEPSRRLLRRIARGDPLEAAWSNIEPTTMKPIVAGFAILLSNSALAQESLVVPPQVEALAIAHHCHFVTEYAASPEALKNPPFDVRYGKDGYANMVASWCMPDVQKALRSKTFTLLVSIVDSSNPLYSCNGEIQNLKHIGGLAFRSTEVPSSRFLLLDSGLPADARNSLKPVRFGIVVTYDDKEDFYACIAGKWAGVSRNGNPPDQ